MTPGATPECRWGDHPLRARNISAFYRAHEPSVRRFGDLATLRTPRRTLEQNAYAASGVQVHASIGIRIRRGRRTTLGSCAERYAACGAISTMRSASRAAEIRSRSGMVGMTPRASRRDRAGWVMPARAASSTWDSLGPGGGRGRGRAGKRARLRPGPGGTRCCRGARWHVSASAGLALVYLIWVARDILRSEGEPRWPRP